MNAASLSEMSRCSTPQSSRSRALLSAVASRAARPPAGEDVEGGEGPVHRVADVMGRSSSAKRVNAMPEPGALSTRERRKERD